MKKLFIIASIATATFTFTACGGNGTDTSGAKTDSSSSVVHPPDNNSATNPSLADTAYSKDSTSMKKDSIIK